MANSEEMMESIYFGMKQMQDVLPQIAEALTQLTIINERQTHNAEEHKIIWQRLDEHSTELKEKTQTITEIKVQQEVCLKRQAVEEKQEAAVDLQNRGNRFDLAKTLVSVLLGVILTLALMHGPQLLAGSGNSAPITKK